ncbi:zinc-binding dehydrogenase [Timonella sp. A28]|uniref:zinc-binding dehydrogenase n=1 Tax=Timonella sp. A28 TaxID=3442640 RepID=UPI003EC082CB
MRAGVVTHFDTSNPLAGLQLIDVPEPTCAPHWSLIQVRAAALNHHDLWSLKGVGLRESQLPMTLGTDAAGITEDGQRVVVHGVIGADGHGVGPTERRSLLSEKYSGTLSEKLAVPTANLIPIPDSMTFETAACLPTAWLTAYALVFNAARITPGQSVLIQGAGGGVSTAAATLALAAGATVYVTSRSAEKRDRISALGAYAAAPGERLPERVDAVIETVGRATWSHSLASVKPEGIVAVAGATSGDPTTAELTRIFFNQIRVQGVTMGTRKDLAALVNFVAHRNINIPIDSVFPFEKLQQAMERLHSGQHFGKIVVTVGHD